MICTVNNDDQTAHLKLVKTITNNNGGTATVTDWTLTATGPTTIRGITGTGDVDQDVNAGSYTLSETGPAGYAGTWSCVTAAGDPVTVNANNGITVALAQSVTCTVNNDDQPAHLTLVKKVVNDNGGTAAATAWTLTAAGPTSGVSGATGTTPVTGRAVNAGTYTLSESGGPTGYDASAWSCVLTGQPATTVPVTNATVTLALGQDVTCTITNSYSLVPVRGLTIVKAAFEAKHHGWVPSDGIVDFGDTVGFTLTVTATGNMPQTNVVVTDTLQPGMTYVNGSATCLNGVACTISYNPDTQTLAATIDRLDPGQQVIVSFKVTIDAAPAIAAGTTYTWHGENVGAVKSNEVRKVTSNEVTLRAHYEELAKTGAAHLEVGGFGLISLLLGAGLMIATKRRRRDTA